MRSYILYFALTIAALPAVLSCSRDRHSGTPSAVEAVVADSLLPQSVKTLVSAINDSDSVAFASLVSYPLLRPYPLHDIPDARAMSDYYHILVDDSLRNIVTGAAPERWQRFGWRGWSLDDGRYIWLDDSVYSVEYLSGVEQRLLAQLRDNEIESLDPSLRGNWTPVACLRAVGSPAVYRIDMSRDKNDRPIYRLAGWASHDDMNKAPEMIMTGYVDVEGSAAMTSYSFSAPDGSTAFYQADVADGSAPAILFSSPVTGESEIAVEPAYWLDILKNE